MLLFFCFNFFVSFHLPVIASIQTLQRDFRRIATAAGADNTEMAPWFRLFGSAIENEEVMKQVRSFDSSLLPFLCLHSFHLPATLFA